MDGLSILKNTLGGSLEMKIDRQKLAEALGVKWLPLPGEGVAVVLDGEPRTERCASITIFEAGIKGSDLIGISVNSDQHHISCVYPAREAAEEALKSENP